MTTFRSVSDKLSVFTVTVHAYSVLRLLCMHVVRQQLYGSHKCSKLVCTPCFFGSLKLGTYIEYHQKFFVGILDRENVCTRKIKTQKFPDLWSQYLCKKPNIVIKCSAPT